MVVSEARVAVSEWWGGVLQGVGRNNGIWKFGNVLFLVFVLVHRYVQFVCVLLTLH